MDSDTLEVHIPITSVKDVVAARQKGRAIATQLGFSPSEATLMAAAISELARNIVTYATEGEIALGRVGDHTLVLVATDKGPGIPNTELALQGGYSTSGGLGLGLAGVRRISDQFDIKSTPEGTTITVWKRRP